MEINFYRAMEDARRMLEQTVLRTLGELRTAHSRALAEALNVSLRKITRILSLLEIDGRVEIAAIIPHPDFYWQWVRVWRLTGTTHVPVVAPRPKPAPPVVVAAPSPTPEADDQQPPLTLTEGITEEDLRWMQEQRLATARRRAMAQMADRL